MSNKHFQDTKINEFLMWANNLGFGKFVYRGVSNEDYIKDGVIEASTYRRLEKMQKPTFISDSEWDQLVMDGIAERPKMLLRINQDIIKDAQRQGHDLKEGKHLSDLDLLAELQHYGTATCLVDFTYDALVALWVACQPSSKGNVNGKVVAINLYECNKVNNKKAKKKIDYFLKPEKNSRYKTYYWQPKNQNNRIIAQSSIFIFSGGRIETNLDYIIPKEDKDFILTDLEKLFGKTGESLFPDFEGFAKQRAHNKVYTLPNVYGYIDLAEIALREDNFDKAINICTEALSLKPNNTGLIYLYYIRTRAYKKKGKYDDALKDCNIMITISEKVPNLIVNGYHLRGKIQEDNNNQSLAMEDYNRAKKAFPKDAEVYYDLALLKIRQKCIKKATKYLQTALTLANEKNNFRVKNKEELIEKIKKELDDLN